MYWNTLKKYLLLGGSLIVPLILAAGSAYALKITLGVVKSRDNAEQWGQIVNRLKATGIDYCTLDAKDWQDLSDLQNIRVLMLPNVSNLSATQVETLNKWTKKGGKLIVTGPTGTLSLVEVRSRLQEVVGASWRFTNNSPYIMEVKKDQKPFWGEASRLYSNITGGVLIPNEQTQTIATWINDGEMPAITSNDQAIYLGWSWGQDSVASLPIDKTWLEVALNHYGINGSNTLLSENEKRLCNLSHTRLNENRQIVLNVENVEKKNQVDKPIEVISANQIDSLRQELENLIARIESSLITAKAKNTAQSQLASEQAITESKKKLEQFNQLVEKGNYKEAREKWLETRRLLWDKYPTNIRYNQSEIRAIWLDRGTLVNAKTEKDLAVIFDHFAQAGINTVFLETVNSGYPIYHSLVAPEQNPLTRDWDRLRIAIKLAHERKMELHAWVWIFAAANQGHNAILNLPKNYLGPILSRHPDWINKSKSGEDFDRGLQYRKAFLDPGNPQARQYILSILEEIVTNYDVDGIQLDYIRYPFQLNNPGRMFGYGKSSRWLFKNQTGVDPLSLTPSSPLWSQWINFRIHLIDSFVETASTMLRQKRPNLVISAAVFPYPLRDRLLKIQQNWEEWGKNNWVDMFAVMTYAMDTDTLEEKTQPLLKNASAGSALIVPGLRLLKVPDSVMADQVQLMRNLPTLGYVLFAAEGFSANTNFQEILNRTQGSIQNNTNEPIPYRQPFQSAVWRYQSLQQEWNLLISENRLNISQDNLNEWKSQANQLSDSLQRLAKVPSVETLKQTQDLLTSFKGHFPLWLKQQKTISQYQVEIWQSRLASVERLLNYGQRTVLGENRLQLGSK